MDADTPEKVTTPTSRFDRVVDRLYEQDLDKEITLTKGHLTFLAAMFTCNMTIVSRIRAAYLSLSMGNLKEYQEINAGLDDDLARLENFMADFIATFLDEGSE